MTPEQQARVGIDALLAAAGWHVCHLADVNLNAGSDPARGVGKLLPHIATLEF